MVQQFREAGFMVDMKDDPGSTLNKKIRSAQLAQYNYIFGKEEKLKPLCYFFPSMHHLHLYLTDTDVSIFSRFIFFVLFRSGGW